jgi:hypothetical protein
MPQYFQNLRFCLLAFLLICAGSVAKADQDNASPPRAEAVAATSAVSVSNASTPDMLVYLSTDQLDNKRKLTIGDHVSYRVLEDKNPAVDLTVTDAGDLEVPLLGRVSAAGKTCRSLAYEMKPVLEKTDLCDWIRGLAGAAGDAAGRGLYAKQGDHAGGRRGAIRQRAPGEDRAESGGRHHAIAGGGRGRDHQQGTHREGSGAAAGGHGGGAAEVDQFLTRHAAPIQEPT